MLLNGDIRMHYLTKIHIQALFLIYSACSIKSVQVEAKEIFFLYRKHFKKKVFLTAIMCGVNKK